MKAQCPSCGAEVSFRSRTSVFAVCPFCRSMLVRHDLDLKNLGKMAELRQASVSDLITERVSREDGYVVVTMRRYPRFLARELRDEYLHTMAPDSGLHEDWISAKRRYHDHNGAFARELLGAKAEEPRNAYPVFRRRLLRAA